ncbi:MAG: hypothetical protein ACXVKA_17890 [Acidimicrobiia bacterium]
MAEPTSYQGGSFFLRWWPVVLLAVALAMFRLGGFHTIQWVTLLIVMAVIHARWMPFTGLGYELKEES